MSFRGSNRPTREGDGDSRFQQKVVILTGSGNYRLWRKDQENLAHSKGYFQFLTEEPTPYPDAPPEDPLLAFLGTAPALPAIEEGQDISPEEERRRADRAADVKNQTALRVMAEFKRLQDLAAKEHQLAGKAMQKIASSVSTQIRLGVDQFTSTVLVWHYLENSYGMQNQAVIDTLNNRLLNLYYANPRTMYVISAVYDLVSQLEAAGHHLEDGMAMRHIFRIMANSPRPQMVHHVALLKHDFQKDVAHANLDDITASLRNMEVELDEIEKRQGFRDRKPRKINRATDQIALQAQSEPLRKLTGSINPARQSKSVHPNKPSTSKGSAGSPHSRCEAGC